MAEEGRGMGDKETDNSSANYPESFLDWAIWVGGAAIWVAVVGVIWYAGLPVVFAIIAAVWWAARRILRKRHAFVPAAAVHAGQMAVVLSVSLVSGANESIFDVFILGAAVCWLLYKPSFPAVICLTLYQLLGLAFSSSAFMDQPGGSLLHRALLGHIVLRLLALFLMWQAVLKTHRERAEQQATTPST